MSSRVRCRRFPDGIWFHTALRDSGATVWASPLPPFEKNVTSDIKKLAHRVRFSRFNEINFEFNFKLKIPDLDEL